MKNFGKIISIARNKSQEGLNQTLDVVKEIGGLKTVQEDIALQRLFPIVKEATTDGDAATAIFCCLNGELFIMNDKNYATPGAFPQKLIDCILAVAEADEIVDVNGNDTGSRKQVSRVIRELIGKENFEEIFKDFDRVLCDDKMRMVLDVCSGDGSKLCKFANAFPYYLSLIPSKYDRFMFVMKKTELEFQKRAKK